MLVTSLSLFAVLFIFIYIGRDAIPFFTERGVKEFFTSARWYPSHTPSEFGALAMFFGTGLVTLGAVLLAVPLGVAAAVCLSDVLPFKVRQIVKPVIEMLAARAGPVGSSQEISRLSAQAIRTPALGHELLAGRRLM